jgi:hypothetical protein
MFKRIAMAVMLLAAAAFTTASMAAQDPTLHQVYQAAQAGRMDEAQSMMQQVLHDHPNSAKAHFVEAELLARQNRLASAKSEFDTAQRLAPGLPFAKPQAVQNLERRLSSSSIHAVNSFAPAGTGFRGGPGTGLPWGTILIGVALVAALFFFIRSRNRYSAPFSPVSGGGARYGNGGSGGYGMQPYAANGAYSPMGQAGGIGSGIVSGLATGAAMGAGVVAGEALMHHFTDGSRPSFNPMSAPVANSWDTTPDDMGGNDFGIADNSSWDDSGSDVVDDWGT